nr:MAG TPA: hypothetical protein [Caudoviricetes sp.]
MQFFLKTRNFGMKKITFPYKYRNISIIFPIFAVFFIIEI